MMERKKLNMISTVIFLWQEKKRKCPSTRELSVNALLTLMCYFKMCHDKETFANCHIKYLIASLVNLCFIYHGSSHKHIFILHSVMIFCSRVSFSQHRCLDEYFSSPDLICWVVVSLARVIPVFLLSLTPIGYLMVFFALVCKSRLTRQYA